MELTKEECLVALNNIQEQLIVIDDYETGATYLECEEEIDNLKDLINEHFDNPPFKFEELEIGIPYWDNKDKEWCFFTTLNKDIETGVKIEISRIPMMSAFEFEEERFYAREVDKCST